MEQPDSSLPYSQVSAICPYSKYQSNIYVIQQDTQCFLINFIHNVY
jgi:hypothetical protein